MDEGSRIECLKKLFSEKRLVPALIDAGALPMIESYRNAFPSFDLTLLQKIEKENKTADQLIKAIPFNVPGGLVNQKTLFAIMSMVRPLHAKAITQQVENITSGDRKLRVRDL